MTRSPSLCTSTSHVWRRHESERDRRLSPVSFCDCGERQFAQMASGERYDVAYFNANGLILQGRGLRTRGVADE